MEDNPLDVLPEDIKVNIFSRLRVDSVLDCKLVCRAWRRDLLQFHYNTTYFSDLHLRYQYGNGVLAQKQHHKPFEHYHYGYDSDIISFVGFQTYRSRDLWYLEYHDDDEISTNMPSNYHIRKMNLNLPVDVWGTLGGSDNGLICLTVRTKYNGIPVIGNFARSPNEPLYICNPMTREFVILPRILIDEKKSNESVHIVYGFGYHPIVNKYKVVRISYVGNPKTPTFKGHVEVYTLGSGSGWQSIGETDYYLWPEKYNVGDPVGVCVNGALHWPRDGSADIVAFDLADEEFYLLPTPSTQIVLRRLFVMRRRHLCIEYYSFMTDNLELWFLNKDNNSCSYPVNGKYYGSWSWNRQLTTVAPPVSQFLRWSIISHTKRGEVLLTNGREVVHYNQETSKRITDFNPSTSGRYLLPHINSFVSLQSLGERNVMKLVGADTAQES